MALRPKAKSGLGKVATGAKGVKPACLKILLQHGDIIIMHGNLIQKLYEVRSVLVVSVVQTNFSSTPSLLPASYVLL
jgi:hypothetical protein